MFWRMAWRADLVVTLTHRLGYLTQVVGGLKGPCCCCLVAISTGQRPGLPPFGELGRATRNGYGVRVVRPFHLSSRARFEESCEESAVTTEILGPQCTPGTLPGFGL